MKKKLMTLSKIEEKQIVWYEAQFNEWDDKELDGQCWERICEVYNVSKEIDYKKI